MLTSIDRQRESYLQPPNQTEWQKPDRTQRQSTKVGMYAATLEGGMFNANPNDNLASNTADEVPHIANFATYVARVRRQPTEPQQSSTRNSHNECHACYASPTKLYNNASSTALSGHITDDGQLAP